MMQFVVAFLNVRRSEQRGEKRGWLRRRVEVDRREEGSVGEEV